MLIVVFNRPQLFRPVSWRKRLWQGAILLTLVLATMIGANRFVEPPNRVTTAMLGHDFLAFYTAGRLVRDGRGAELYDLNVVAGVQRGIAREAGLTISVDLETRSLAPWWNPPLYAWLFLPFTLVEFNQALIVWTSLNILCTACACYLLVKMLSARRGGFDSAGRAIDWRTTALVPILVVISLPFLSSLAHGQNTPISLLVLCATVYFWRNKRAILAGAFCALLFYKPQLAVVVATILVLSLGARALIGLVYVGSAQIICSQLIDSDGLTRWLRKIPTNLRFMQIDYAYMWDRHVTLRAFWRLLLQGRAAGDDELVSVLLAVVSGVVVAAMLLRAAWSQRTTAVGVDHAWSRLTERAWRDRLIIATICSMPLLVPFYFDYDLLLLAVPAVLLAGEELSRPVDQPTRGYGRLSVPAFFTLYGWMVFNPHIATLTHVNITVILLSGLAVVTIGRATRQAAVPDVSTGLENQPMTPGRRRAA